MVWDVLIEDASAILISNIHCTGTDHQACPWTFFSLKGTQSPQSASPMKIGDPFLLSLSRKSATDEPRRLILC